MWVTFLCGQIQSPRPDLITLYNVCSVPRGSLEYHGGYHDKCGGISWVLWGYLEYWRGHSVLLGISWCTWGIPWVPWGCSVPWKDTIFCNLSNPMVLNTLPLYHDIPSHASYPSTILKLQKMISPTVLSILHGIQDIPHGTQDIPHSTHDNSPRYSWYPSRYSW